MSKKALGAAFLVFLLVCCADGGDQGHSAVAPLKSVERTLLASTGASSQASALASTRDADLLNAAATVYLTRRAVGDVPDVLLAAEAAERAWRIRETADIAWNRAEAREALHVPSQALIAWNDYLRLDPDSARSREARERIRRLSAITQSRRWIAARDRLLERNEIAFDLPQEMRSFGEEQLLSSWSEAVLRGDGESARRSLQLAQRIGEELASSSGERLLADSVEVLSSAGEDTLRRLAAAHVRYANGKRLLRTQQMREAASELAKAAQDLETDGTPFAYRAALYAATAKYYAADLDRAEALLRELVKRQQYLTVTGQAEWVIGLIEYSRGHSNEALTAYRSAQESFERVGELENSAAMDTLLGETYRAIGQSMEAWLHQERALRSMQRLGATRRSHTILSDAARSAAAWNVPLAALIFQSALVSIARLSNDPVSICDALIGHATHSGAAGERTTALEDIAEVERVVATIQDRAMRDRTRANLLAAEVAVWRNFDRRRAADSATKAIAEMSRLGNRARLVHLRLEAGRALYALADSANALAQWKEGIAECERQRAALSDREYRRTYFEQCRSLFDEAIGVLAGERRFAEAREIADAGRARALRDGLLVNAVHDVRLPHEVTTVELCVLPDRIVIWTTDESGMSGSIAPIGRAALKRAVDEILAARSDEHAFRAASAKLYDVLVRPVETRLGARVVLVPDLDSYRIPFAALFDARRGRYLVETHEVMIAPSASLLARRSDRHSASPSRALLIETSSGGLRGAAREIARIGPLYPGATILRGSAYTSGDVVRSLQSAEMIHIAGHALRNSDLADPALVLESGLIYPSEIALLRLPDARLVILSACGTASGRISSDGPLSIARAFLAAGSRRVVATLWDVDDDTTAGLMIRFHRLLRDDPDPLRALQTLQREAIHDSVPAGHWAALEILQTEL